MSHASADTLSHVIPALARPPVGGVDLAACEREPVHAPGAIQGHGALIAALADSMLVSHASANLAEVLGCTADSVLGRTLEQAIGGTAFRALMNADANAGFNARFNAEAVYSRPGRQGGTLQFRAHRTGRHVCVDIEAVPFKPTDRLPVVMVEAVLKTFEHAASCVELCELAVHGLKAISGYDRVMAYRFVESGHGEVIAEARQPQLDSYLGLRYPASDIPPPARRLYLRQHVGSIANAAASPVSLLTDPALDDGAMLDLTHSSLRSVSPVHREYMRNMGTAASLTIALAHGPELWGMLVCHHGVPRVAAPDLRAAAGAIGLVVSLLLASLAESEAYAQRLERAAMLRALVDRLSAPLALAEALAAADKDLLRVVGATGAMLHFAGKTSFVGSTPAPEAAALAMATLRSRARGEVLGIDDVGLSIPGLATCTREGSGALLLQIAPGSDDAVLWFRPEVSRTVVWGGDPSQHAIADPLSGRISPRASFAAWKETVAGRSEPWTEVDLALARDFGAAIRTESANRTKAELQEAQARLGLLAEHSGVVVALSGLDGVRHYVSPAAERVLGWSAEQLVGRSALDFIHPDDWQAVREANKSMRNGNPQSSATYRFRRPDGSWLWIDAHARLRASPDGEGPSDYVVVLRDATERKAVEQKLIEALDRMGKMAATDGLTGLANRRHLDITADREWRRCARSRLPLSALLVDADRFKLFNDRYGHQAGDNCLRAIASQIAAVAQRPADVAARYGGEEFVLLMPGTSHDGALLVATRLCNSVQELGIDHEENAGFGVVTVSIGVASALPGDPQSPSGNVAALLNAADAALYRAKCAGRNRVVAG